MAKIKMSIGSNYDMPKASKMPPEVSFDEKELPQIKDWKVGDKYELKLKVEQVSLEKDRYDGDRLHARFKVLKVEPYKPKTYE